MATHREAPIEPPHLNSLLTTDKELAPIKALNITTPPAGWIRVIRTALRMSQAELATLLSINQKSLHTLEASEAKKTIRLDSLEKVADALDCDLVYALVPRDSLENHYRDRAHSIASAQLAGIANTMALENQPVKITEEKVEKLTKELISGDFVQWKF
jgi:predicted DNA-binding mobile mystery protein A